MGPFDRFNDRAKRVLALAQDEAIRLGHDHIGPEHLMLGLIREGEGVAARVLDSFGIKLSVLRTDVESKIGRVDRPTPPSEIRLHSRTKRILELAIDEAKRLGHSHVGTEHLLLGMAREAGTVASEVLSSFGVALEQVRERTIDTLGGKGAAATGAHTGMPREVAFDAEGRKRDWYCEDVLSGKLTVRVLYEDERVLGFEHPYPHYRTHGVVVPKKHVPSLSGPEALDGELLVSMLRGVQAVAAALGLADKGFRMESNANAPGVTPHMHWHVAGPGLPPPQR